MKKMVWENKAWQNIWKCENEIPNIYKQQLLRKKLYVGQKISRNDTMLKATTTVDNLVQWIWKESGL